MEGYAVWIVALAEVGRVSSARGCSRGVEKLGRGGYRKEHVSLLWLSDTITKFEQFMDGSRVDERGWAYSWSRLIVHEKYYLSVSRASMVTEQCQA